MIPTSPFELDQVEVYIFNLDIVKCKDGRYFTSVQIPMKTVMPAQLSQEGKKFAADMKGATEDISLAAIAILVSKISFKSAVNKILSEV